MSSELAQIIDIMVKEKGIKKEAVIDAIKSAVISAAKKKLGMERDLEVRFDEKRGEIELYEYKEVVETVEDPDSQVALDKASEIDTGAAVGDVLGFKIDPHSFGDFGRIAAQAAKQVIIQRVKDAERLVVYDEFKDRVGELISGVVRRFERGNMVIDLGKPEAILPHTEQVPRESYRVGDRIRAYVIQVQKETKGPQIILSRKNAEFVRKLFETEVPEISEGIVKIEAIAREPGVRTKIAVSSKDSDVDPVGACVGMKGSRVQAVVQELRGEKIDIISWTKDIASNICNALAPAEISRMIIDDDQQNAQVVVPDDQLSLAIGKRGQNVRLAVQLTKWDIDIKSETEMKDLIENAQKSLGQIPGIGNIIAQKLYQEGFTTPEELAKADPELLMSLPGIGHVKAEKIVQSAKDFLKQMAKQAKKSEPAEPKSQDEQQDAS
jgi:transcription termination/antitermination protein NusA